MTINNLMQLLHALIEYTTDTVIVINKANIFNFKRVIFFNTKDVMIRIFHSVKKCNISGCVSLPTKEANNYRIYTDNMLCHSQ